MESRFSELLQYELDDDCREVLCFFGLVMILAEEFYNSNHDEKWLLWIAKALYAKQLYYRCSLCLQECSSVKATCAL